MDCGEGTATDYSFLGLLFLSLDYLIKTEFTALDGDQDVGVLGRWSHKLRHNIFILFACAHAEWLEALQTILLVDLELLEGETSVLDQVGEKGSKLNRFNHLLIVREVLHGDSYRANDDKLPVTDITICTEREAGVTEVTT